MPTPSPAADKAAFWRQTIAEFTRSGQSVRAFCAARGLAEKRFYTWRRSLGLSPVSPPKPRSPAFVPVALIPDIHAEIVLPGGLTLRVPLHADPAGVARLAAALGTAAC